MIVNGVTLPDVPAEVLAEFPYVIIANADLPEIAYIAVVSSKEFVHCSGNLVGFDPEKVITTFGSGDMLTIADGGTEWESMGFPFSEGQFYWDEADVGLDEISTAQDIYTIASYDSSTGEYTKSDIWMAANISSGGESPAPKPTRVSIGISLMDGYAKQVQRLTGDPIQINAVTMRDLLKTANGKPLPEIPADVLAKYPNAIITYTYSDSYDTYWLYASQSEFFCGDFASLGMGTGDGMGTFGLLGYYGLDKTNNVWYLVDERTGDTVEFGTFGNMTAEFVWANHNIHEMTSLDLTTMEYTLGGIYYPPQIETDNRASIGYDLFDDIVVQVQRLSGTSEKMNGITAYQKLCCVMAVEEGGNNPGEIIINGVKLPPFPEVDYPYAFIYVQDLSQYGEIVYYLQFSAEKYFYHYLNSNDGYTYAPSDYSAGTIQYRLYKSKIAEGQIWYGEEPTEAFYKDYGKSGIKWSNYDIRKDDPDTGEIVVKRTV